MTAMVATIATTVLPQPCAAQDEPHGVREFTESTTWRVPAGVAHIIVELWGGGGRGAAGGGSTVAGGASVPGGGGGGGGSGAYVRGSFAVKSGEIYAIRIGAGGSGGRGEGAGADGQDTAIVLDGNVILVARGGRGGGSPHRHDIKGGIGGRGGIAVPEPTHLVRGGNEGGPGHDGGLPESYSTFGGNGGGAVMGTVRPPGSFGGNGGAAQLGAPSETGSRGGSGSAVITW
jgi:hypothetical protein